MKIKNEAKKAGSSSVKGQKIGLKQRSYDDKFELKVLREMDCTGETLAALSKADYNPFPLDQNLWDHNPKTNQRAGYE